MPAVQVQHYIDRATDFYEAMQLMKGDAEYQNSSALLAIHSAIAHTDALRIGLGDRTLTADDHNSAIESLQLLLSARQVLDQNVLKHLKHLIASKTMVSYGSQAIPTKSYELLFLKAARFAGWANDIGIQLQIEGWQHGDD